MEKERIHSMRVGGNCICPKCGERTAHQRGVPCEEEWCPNCGAKLLRKGSYHHELLEEKRVKKKS